jgi:hypothetical protein
MSKQNRTTAPRNSRRASKTAGKPTTTKPETAAVPDWLTDTPPVDYSLEMYVGESQQTISLTREEFIALKLHLAAMRGYAIPETEEGQ